MARRPDAEWVAVMLRTQYFVPIGDGPEKSLRSGHLYIGVRPPIRQRTAPDIAGSADAAKRAGLECWKQENHSSKG
jgi:hypothetical protein